MRYLRMVLLILSFAGAVGFALAAKHAAGEYREQAAAFVFLLVACLLAANSYFLFETPPPVKSRVSRLARMWSLWLAAKEKDLQRRAGD